MKRWYYGVTRSIDHIIQIHARIILKVVVTRAIFFHIFLLCLTDITNTIARFFPCLTLSDVQIVEQLLLHEGLRQRRGLDATIF